MTIINWLAQFPNIVSHPGSFLMFAWFILVFWPLFWIWKTMNGL